MLAFALLAAVSFGSNGHAVEGGYSNYIPGSYGDFAMAVGPEARLTLRNDFYFYSADVDRSVRSGRVEAGAGVEFGLPQPPKVFSAGRYPIQSLPSSESWSKQYVVCNVVFYGRWL